MRAMQDKAIAFTKGAVLDVHAGVLRRAAVTVKDGRILAVGDTPARAGEIEELDLGGRVIMPGLIDLHVHILAPGRGRSTAYPDVMPSFMHYHSTVVLRDFLKRGFTTVRDAGGAD